MNRKCNFGRFVLNLAYKPLAFVWVALSVIFLFTGIMSENAKMVENKNEF